MAHDTKLGLNASLNSAMTSGSVSLGYDRRFVTWVPRSVAESASTPQAKDVMAVIACSKLKVGFLRLDLYDESMATGRAAVDFAQALATDAALAKKYFACFVAEEEATTAPAAAPAAGDGT
jgi:hypothetical protein